jgi:SAM-dependent methyltransferase
MPEYILDHETGVHILPDKKGIGYADGGERKLLQILSSVGDRSIFSEELLPHMSDWPTEYHLSRKRHLILRSLNIKPGDRVLELGCGCGAITRYLLEAGAQVTAVEGELARAAVAAKRCEGFDTVQFIADDFLNLKLDNQYDWVLMIGVFEYSQKYGKSADRQAEYLNIARRHLAAEGTLVIAIENKLGIKYLNGAGEDHNGKLHYGPHDLYEGNDITTWGRQEIRDILVANGFAYQHFSGVFPDYKLPKIILDEAIDRHRDFRAEELLHYCRSLDYRGMNQRFFDESLLAGSLRKNGLLIDMANSFLITAKISASPPADPSRLAVYYAVDRKSDFCTETQFVLKDGETVVLKRKLKTADPRLPHLAFATAADGSLIKVEHDVDTRALPYHPGQLLGQAFTKAIKRGQLHQADELVHNWVAYLVAHFRFYSRTTGRQLPFDKIKGRELSNLLIDGESVDCGPQNIVSNTYPEAFDLEWKAGSPIPLAWQLTRNCQHILRTGYGSQALVNLTQLVGLTANCLGVVATTEDVEEGLYIEKQFQEAVGYAEPANHIKLFSLG